MFPRVEGYDFLMSHSSWRCYGNVFHLVMNEAEYNSCGEKNPI